MSTREEDREFLRYRDSRDPRAMARVFDLTASRLLLLAMHVVRDASEAEDLVQTTFLQAIQDADRFESKGSGSLLAWLMGILTHRAKDAKKKRRRRGERTEAWEQCPDLDSRPGPLEQLQGRDALEHVQRALDALPQRYRHVLILRLVHGLKAVEIAHSLDRSPETVRTQLRRGLKMLRDQLPKSLVVPSMFTLLAGDGLAAVRDQVLRAAVSKSAIPATAGAAGITLGVITMKKSLWIAAVVVGAACLGCLGLSLWQQTGADPAPDTANRQGSGERSVTSKSMGAGDGAAERPGSDGRRQLLAESQRDVQPVTAATGSLLLEVVYGDDRTPVPDLGVVINRWHGQLPAPPRWVRTDAAGKVRVTGLMPGKFLFSVARQQIVRETAMITAGEETKFVITLDVGVDVAGVVVDRDGVAVAGATILVSNWSGSMAWVNGQADAQGRFRIRQVAKNGFVGARARGSAPSALYGLNATVVPDGARVGTGVVRLRIVLPGPGGGLQGQVLGPDGKAVTQAELRLGRDRSGSHFRLPDGSVGRYPPTDQTRTDNEGRFRFFGIQPGETPISVSAPGLVPWSGKTTIVAGVVTPLTIRMQQGVTCLGTVCDDAGKPASGVSIVMGSCFTVTVADGSFRLEGLTPGSITLFAHHDEDGKARTVLWGRAGETVRWDAQLSRGLVLEGRVLDEADNPVEQVLVKATGPKKKNARWPWSGDAWTDADGRFSVLNCPKGAVLRLSLRKPKYKIVYRRDVDPAVHRQLVFRMPSEGTVRITGTVLDPDGQPIGNAMVSLRRLRDPSFPNVYMTAAKTGKFDVDELRPCAYRVFIRAGPYPSYYSPERAVGPGETWDLGDVRLVHGGHVRVQVDDTRGDKAAPYYLSFRQRGGHVGQVDMRAKPLRSGPLVPGRYDLRVTGPAVVLSRTPVMVREGQETSVRVTIRAGTPRIFALSLPAGTEDVRSVQFNVRGTGGFRFARRLGRWSQFPFFRHKMGFAPGRYRLHAHTEQGFKANLEFEVKADSGSSPETIRVTLK